MEKKMNVLFVASLIRLNVGLGSPRPGQLWLLARRPWPLAAGLHLEPRWVLKQSAAGGGPRSRAPPP